jgi:hypothetical protein
MFVTTTCFSLVSGPSSGDDGPLTRPKLVVVSYVSLQSDIVFIDCMYI